VRFSPFSSEVKVGKLKSRCLAGGRLGSPMISNRGAPKADKGVINVRLPSVAQLLQHPQRSRP
jgi:hypothetical protein